jgi:predicted transcriptional regulator
VYSVGIDLAHQDAAVTIGAACRICDRPACPQRAFPYVVVRWDNPFQQYFGYFCPLRFEDQ